MVSLRRIKQSVQDINIILAEREKYANKKFESLVFYSSLPFVLQKGYDENLVFFILSGRRRATEGKRWKEREN